MMNRTPTTSILGGLAILVGLVSLACALKVPWPADEPFPALLYFSVSPGAASATFAIAALVGLASGALLLAGQELGLYVMIAGLGWDVLCQLCGLAGGRPHCVLWLAVDAGLIAVLWSARART